MSTTSAPCPFAAAVSRADRSVSAFVMSISSGAATTGTPWTTSTGNLSSGICAPPVAAGTATARTSGPGTGIPEGAGRGCGPVPARRRGPVRGTTRISPPPAGCQYKTRENLHAILLASSPSRDVYSESMSDPDQNGGAWTLLTGHGHVLVEIARNPQARIRDISPVVGLTERSVQAIVADLEAAGYLTRTRTGRRVVYTVNRDSLFRHSAQDGHRVGPFLDLLANGTEITPGPEDD